MTQSTETDVEQIDRPPAGVGDGRALLAWLARMRETDPVWKDDLTGATHVFRYRDLLKLMGDPATFGSDFGDLTPTPGEGAPNFMEGVLTMTDPPRHAKLRRLVSQAFTPRTIAALEPRIVNLTNELFDAVAGQDEFDLVAAVSYPLPVIVIAEMLGIPSADRDLFRRWGEALLSTNYELPVGAIPDGQLPEHIVTQLREMHDYLLSHVTDRRARQRDDLISRLVGVEVDGERLSDGETVSFLNFLLLAGHLTTTLLMGNTLLCFRDYPDAEREVRADRGLMPNVTEEVLRYRPPVVFQARITRVDTTLGGTEIAARTPIISWLMSGNRDGAQFADPDTFNIHRNPNNHLTFGHGIHFCLGTPLARIESRVVMNALLDRYREVSCGEPTYYDRSPDIFGLKSLPVTVRAA